MNKTNIILSLLFLLPTFFLILLFMFYPLFYSLVISFYDVNPSNFQPTKFVGLKNYIEVISSTSFIESIKSTFIFVFLTVSLSVLIGLGLSLLLNLKGILAKILRGVFITPWAIPPIVAAVMWKLMYHTQFGLLNAFLDRFGIQKISFLGDPNIAMLSISIADCWIYASFCALMILPYLQSIPLEIEESASLDGANSLQKFRYIMLPLIKPGLLIAIIIKSLFSFTEFAIVYALTGGGPAGTTNLISYYIYTVSFKALKFNYAASLSYILALISFLFCIFYVYLFRRAG